MKKDEQNRKRQARHRERLKQAGLVACLVWVMPEHRKAVRDYARALAEREGRSE
jgi:hypothetical protein